MVEKIMKFLLLVISFVWFSSVSADYLTNQKDVDEYIARNMVQWNIPGLALAIVKDGEIVVTRGYGTRELGKDLPVDEHTLFQIGSITKSVTANALAILVGEGKLGWDDLMIECLPGFQTGDATINAHSTVRDVLAQRTGIEAVLGWLAYPGLSRKDLLARMKYSTARYDFRSNWSYSNMMFLAAGEIIPARTGISWDEFVSKRLFAPLGMKHSITSITQFGRNMNIASPHEKDGDKLVTVPHRNSDNIGPAGSIFSSASDMAKWLLFQLNNGRAGDKQIIAEDAFAETRRQQMTVTNFPSVVDSGLSKHFLSYGLGIFISDGPKGYKIYSHSGGGEGVFSSHAYMPELGLGVAILTNSSAPTAEPVLGWILDYYAGSARDDRIDYIAQYVQAMSVNNAKDVLSYRDQTAKPSLQLQSYAGYYSSPLMGDIKIVVDNGGLSFTTGIYRGRLEHINHNTFFMRVDKPLSGRKYYNQQVQFLLDYRGWVKSLSFFGKEYIKLDH